MMTHLGTKSPPFAASRLVQSSLVPELLRVSRSQEGRIANPPGSEASRAEPEAQTKFVVHMRTCVAVVAVGIVWLYLGNR